MAGCESHVTPPILIGIAALLSTTLMLYNNTTDGALKFETLARHTYRWDLNYDCVAESLLLSGNDLGSIRVV